jgi:hypothetical protein
MQFDMGMLFVVIGTSTYSPNTCYQIKYKFKYWWQQITSLYQIAYMQWIRCIEIVLQKQK